MMGLFTTIKETGKTMGNVFESKMPERHYTEKISDLEHQLHLTESILKEVAKGNSNIGYNEAKKYFKKHKKNN
jgi:hypothetical protein|tara:strand:- start:170 stop:388 length:219 start_codon:yes stop_codon:yes gene_type:complete